jgi:hypothetical protein
MLLLSSCRHSRTPIFAPRRQFRDILLKRMDDLLWYQKLGDIADIDKSEYGGASPILHRKNKKAPGATNPLIIHVYTFIPKKLDRSKKQPLIVYVHQGVHQSLDTTIDAHMIRELLEQGYTIVATDYRGSPATARLLRGHRLRRPRGRRRLPRHEVDARQVQLPRPQARRHRRLEPRRPHHADEHLRSIRTTTPSPTPACRSPTWSRAWATRPKATARSTPRPTTSARSSMTTSRSTASARPSTTPRSSTRRCSSTPTPTTRT